METGSWFQNMTVVVLMHIQNTVISINKKMIIHIPWQLCKGNSNYSLARGVEIAKVDTCPGTSKLLYGTCP